MAKQITASQSHLPSSIFNNGLFSNHYLKDRLPERADWQKVTTEAAELFELLRDIWREKADVLQSESEAQLERDWFEPILVGLAYGYVPQAQDKRGKFPDFALYATDSDATKAKRHKNKYDKFYANSLAILEGKRWTRDLDSVDPADLEDKRNPSRQILNYLRTTSVRFGFLTNGRLWRLFDYDSKQPAEAYLEIDLQAIIEHNDPAAFAYFVYFFRSVGYIRLPGQKAPIEEIVEGSAKFSAEVSNKLKAQVFDRAMPLLIEGFVNNNPELKLSLREAVYEESLVYLYRMLFVLYAESRELLPITNDTYYQSSLDTIRVEIEKALLKEIPAAKNSFRYWVTLDNLFNMIDKGAPMSGIPEGYNGGLFDRAKHPFLESNKVSDFYLSKVVHSLTSVATTDKHRISIDYSTLKVRNLGTIYEGLLEQHAIWDERAGKIVLENDKGERKATGSYYTPDYVVDYIVENTLGELIQELDEKARKYKEKHKHSFGGPDKKLRAQARRQAFYDLPAKILEIKVCDPAMGSGHFLVAAVDYLTNRILEKLGAVEFADSQLAGLSKEEIKRRAAKHCIYGVDLNPMAVELAKLSLWLTTVVKNKPLSFLDHHLRHGNSLIGAKINELDRLPPAEKAKKGPTKSAPEQTRLDFATHLGQKLDFFARLNSDIAEIFDQTLSDVLKSDQLLSELNAGRDIYKQIANLWISAFFVGEGKWAHELEEFNEALPTGHQTGLFGGETQIKISADETKTKSLTISSKLYKNAVDAIKNNRTETLRLLKPLLERSDDLAGGRAFFHWELEFPEVFSGRRHTEPGFDAVVGNPPYVRQEQLTDNKPFFKTRYSVYHGMADIYTYFYEAAHGLIRRGGYFGMITSNKFMRSGYGALLRVWLEDNYYLWQLIDFGDLPVFPEATAYPAIFITKNELREGKPTAYAPIKSLDFESLSQAVESATVELPPGAFAGESWSLAAPGLQAIMQKMQSISVSLAEYVGGEIQYGVKTGYNKAFHIDEATRDRLVTQDPRSADIIKPLLVGQDIGRYGINYRRRYLVFTRRGIDIDRYPAIKRYLIKYRRELEPRPSDWDEGKRGKWPGRKAGTYQWYEIQDAVDYYADFEQPKIVLPDIAVNGRFSHDEQASYVGDTGFIISDTSYYLLALLNSSLVLRWFQNQSAVYRGGYLRYKRQYLARIPIRRINFTTPDKKRKNLLTKAIGLYNEQIPPSTLAHSKED